MGWFKAQAKTGTTESGNPPAGPSGHIPTLPVDLDKRYDLYCSEMNHDRLYEDVRFVAIRTFDRPSEFSNGLTGGFLELEQADGSRVLIPIYGIRLLCEHGTRANFKIYRHRRGRNDL